MNFDLNESSSVNCRFCRIDGTSEILRQNSGASVLPSYGAFVAGWLLVVPTRHVYSLAELDDSEWEIFQGLTRDILNVVHLRFGQYIQFEHGSAGPGRAAGCGVDHAHLHVVPLTTDLRQSVAQLDIGLRYSDWEECGDRPELAAASDYLWIKDHTGAWIHRSDGLRSQVVRRALAAQMKVDDWDWKTDLRLDIVRQTVKLLQRDVTLNRVAC